MKQSAFYVFPLVLLASSLCLSVSPGQSTQKAEQDNATSSQSLYQILSAEMAIDREAPEIALANYIAAAKETQDPKIAERATQIALALSSLEVALEPARIWAENAKNNLEAQITVAAIYIRLNKIEEALPFLQAGEGLESHEAYQYFLVLYRQLQKEAEEGPLVVKALEMLTERAPHLNAAFLALAEIYLYQDQAPQALALSGKALKNDPHSTIGIQIHTESLLRTAGKEKAKLFLDEAKHSLPKNPTDYAFYRYYCQFLVQNDYLALAKQEMTLLSQDPALPVQDLLQFARLAMHAKWYDLAHKQLIRASASPDNKELAFYMLGRLAEAQNNTEQAVAYFKQVLTGPFHVLSQIRASVLLSEKGDYAGGLTVLSRAQAQDPADQKQILLSTVELFKKAQRVPEALVLLNTKIEEEPNEIEYRYARSLVATQLNNIELAMGDLKTILSLDPNHLESLNALGFILADKTKNFDEAKQYLTQALSLSPNNASVLDSLGWLQYKMGDYQASVETLKKAEKIMPDAEIAAHLGEVLWKMKEFDSAKQTWQRALSHYPKNESVLKVMHHLINEKQSLN